MNDHRGYMHYWLIRCLHLLKFLFDIGKYDDCVSGIREICEDDYLELALRGLEHVAPVFHVEELGEDVCCGGHTMYYFSDPAIPEYYRLCRLYEHKHGVAPEENPYVKNADDALISYYYGISSDFGISYNDDIHVREICIETCPERPVDEWEIIELIHNTLEYYRSEVETLRAELLKGPVVWLPALPEHIGQAKAASRAKKQRKKVDKTIKKAG
jgi:hypothetical protein